MNDPHYDAGVMAVVMERFETQRLPRILSLKDRVDKGERLDDQDLEFLEEVFNDAHKVKLLIDRHPEYQELSTRVIHLYKDITTRALENENKA
jgi:hypothetical protein